MNQFKVTHSPFIKSANSVNFIKEQKLIMLIMVFVVGLIMTSWQALYLLGVSLASALVFELIYNVVCYEKLRVDFLEVLICSITFTCLIGPKTPLYVPIIAMAFSIIICKMVFGRNENHVVNASAGGALFVGIIFSQGANLFVKVSGSSFMRNPYGALLENNIESFNIIRCLKGQISASIGCVCIAVVAVALIYLIATHSVGIKIPIIAVVSFVLITFAINQFNYEYILPYLFSGNFLFVTTFMLTEFSTSPNTTLGQFIYAIIFGVGASLIIKYSGGGDMAILALLVCVNCLSPLLDRVIRPHYFGEGANE